MIFIITDLQNDTLRYAIKNGIIDMSYIQEQISMNKRKEILNKHGSCIWYSESEQTWYCHIPDSSKKSGRKKVKRKYKSDIEDIVYQYYSKHEFSNHTSTMTFCDLFYEFIEHKKTQVKPATIRRIMIDWNKFYKSHSEFINKPFKSITKIDVDDFLNSIASTNPKDKNFKNACGILKQTFEYAIDSDYMDKTPYRTSRVNKKNIIPTRKNPSEKEVFTIEEQKKLTQELKYKIQENSEYLTPWILLLDFELGTRIGEILAIRESDIKDKRIHIQRQLVSKHDVSDINNIKNEGWEIAEYTKSYAGDRWVPLTDKAIYYIEQIKIINISNRYEDYLFYSPENIITDHSVKSHLERCCLRAGIEPRSPHKIRKTYASRLFEQGVAVSDISKLLGHADETTTLKHYIYSLDNHEELDNKVKQALSVGRDVNGFDTAEKVTKSDQKIIQFESILDIRKTPKNRGILRKI